MYSTSRAASRFKMKEHNRLPNEIERKFLLSALPPGIDSLESSHIEQGYLAATDDDTEVRIRNRSGVFSLTYKKGFGLIREEIEVSISREAFSALWPATEGARVAKTRYIMPWGDLFLEIDAYIEALDSLLMCEIEYPSVESVKSIELPKWLGREITDDIQYSNRNLALYGIPRT
jgi:adenylate cyclase